MSAPTTLRRALPLIAVLAVVTSCGDFPPVATQQTGYRGLGMVQVGSPEAAEAARVANAVPEPLPAAEPVGQLARDVYQNVPVLGHLDVAEFTRLMAAMTTWVSPQQGCAYCHAGNDLAADDVYTKVVSRRMIQMTQHLNTEWKSHVGTTGVTCYTCHRGQNLPQNYWFSTADLMTGSRFAGNRAGQNAPAPSVGYASLPADPFSAYLEGRQNINVVGERALPSGPAPGIKATEVTYGLMMHVSNALGVNCTYCHNTRSFADWDASTAQRATAWYAIRMLRDVNTQYLNPLQSAFPPHRLGPGGDAPKVSCATCHNGAAKPLLGVSMLPAYPALASGPADAAAAPESRPTAPEAPAEGPAATSEAGSAASG